MRIAPLICHHGNQIFLIWKSPGAFVRYFSISCLVKSPFWAPTCWTTDIEFTAPHKSASVRDLPRAIAATVVEAKASPAPVRSNGGFESGYGGTNHLLLPSYS